MRAAESLKAMVLEAMAAYESFGSETFEDRHPELTERIWAAIDLNSPSALSEILNEINELN